jgi:hypothetical protein
MSNTHDSRFIERKIKKLNTAIFSNFSKADLKFPSCLVSELTFNMAGDVIFFIKRAYEDMSGFDPEFSGHMYFFNKDFDYYIEAEGKAFIIVSQDDIGIRFRISHAQYFYSAKMESRGVIRLFYRVIEFLFARKMSERIYDYPAEDSLVHRR